jgi:hypothetical protein
MHHHMSWHEQDHQYLPSETGIERNTAASTRINGSASRLHSSSEWEAMRATIKKLYITESRTLSVVMAILEKSNDFVAT